VGPGLIDKKIAWGFLLHAVHKTKRFRHTASSARRYSNRFPVRHNPFHAVIFFVSGTGKYPGIIPSERLRFSVYGLRVITPKCKMPEIRSSHERRNTKYVPHPGYR